MKKKVLIAAGGTGGHIFPALAFGRWIVEQGEAENVVYISGSRPLEAEIYATYGVKPYCLALSGSPLGGTLWRGLVRCAGLFRSFVDTYFFLRRERPDVCFLFGSYVSFAPLLWCKYLSIPVIAHEQNACAGKTTKLAARMGVPVASGWSECRGVDNAFHAGVPVRSFKRLPRQEAASVLGVKAEDGDLVIGVVGGSLGSAQLGELMAKISGEAVKTAGRRLVFVVLGDQSGASFATFGNVVEFVGRRWGMAPFYSLCDAVVCRSGASTLAELAAYGIPALTIPWSGAADGHQEANARAFSLMTGNPAWMRNEGGLDEMFTELLSCALFTRTRIASNNGGNFGSDAASRALWRFAEEKISLLKSKI